MEHFDRCRGLEVDSLVRFDDGLNGGRQAEICKSHIILMTEMSQFLFYVLNACFISPFKT